MRVLLIGGTGFIGYHAACELNDRGHEVVVLARSAPKENLLPAGAGIVLGDITGLSAADLMPVLEGVDAAVFAAGADDREVPAPPAYSHFHRANVTPVVQLVEAGKKAGLLRVVVIGSYFAHFDRLWPHLRLAQRHPYIRSRIAQSDEAIAAAGVDIEVVTLELPYVFGAAPGRVPLWAPLVRYVTTRMPLLYPAGGTNMIGVGNVAQAVAGAVERGGGGSRHLVGDENLRWSEFLPRLAAAAGLSRRVITVPTPAVRLALRGVRRYHRARGMESGLDPVALADLHTAETFFDPAPSRRALGYGRGDLDEAFARTVAASLTAVPAMR